jgi:hypothetical protein
VSGSSIPFLLVAEVLNVMVAEELAAGCIQGIQLPVEGRQQIMVQYADDTSFTLHGEEGPVKNLIYTLETFCLASGLVLNWQKSNGYWKSSRGLFRLQWTEYLGVTWAEDDAVSKLLGAPLGLELSSGDIDEFLLDRIRKKLTHWLAVWANPIGRAVIVNSVILGACYFFFSICSGRTKKGVARVKTLIINYLASGRIQRSRTKVGWIQCCQSQSQGGINLVNPEDAIVTLMVKWMVKALEPGSSNLHAILRYRLSSYQP